MLAFDDYNYDLLLSPGSMSPLSNSSSSDGLEEFFPNQSNLSDITLKTTNTNIPLIASSSPTSSSSSSAAGRVVQTTKVNRKRRIEDNPRAQFYLPRIPRRDIRRQYAAMFVNAYNSHDFDFMKSYSQTFFREDLTILFRKNVSALHYKEAVCRGCEKSLSMWFDSFADAPDMVIALQKSQIKIRSDGTAVVSSTFQMTGTTIISDAMARQWKEDRMKAKHQKSQVEIPKHCPFTEASVDVVKGNKRKKEVSAFDEELERALDEYLSEERAHSKQLVPKIDSSSDALVTNSVRKIPFVCDGHFSFHLDSDSKIYYCTYSLLSTYV